MAILKEPIMEILTKTEHMQYGILHKDIEDRYRSERGNLLGFTNALVSSVQELRREKRISFVCGSGHEEKDWCKKCEIYLPEHKKDAVEALRARKIMI